jgi:hypothetical protein
MAFYTPSWVRKLVKEDHKTIQAHLETERNDFRSYIDSNTPFVLWLSINLIRERIIARSSPFIKELALAVSQERDVSQIVTDLIDSAYIETINAFANNPRYTKVTDTELEAKLQVLSNSVTGNVKQTIQAQFKNTMVVTNVTKKNKSVMLIFPKFTTLDFGKVYKAQLEKVVKKSKHLKDAKPQAQVGGMFGQLAQGPVESEKSRMLAFVNENFKVLQNVGHVEVDVVSEIERKIMRSQNSPRLLQALVTLPNDIKSFERLQLKFSKETGQAQTRVKIRKRFAGSKLVFELLVEHGLSVGIPETQKDNLYKATLEKAFSIGSGLTAQIRKDISILGELETSKTIKQHIEQNIRSLLKSGKRVADYNSLTDILQTTSITKTKVTTNLKRQQQQTPAVQISQNIARESVSTNLSGLQALLDAQLQDVVSANMGSGDSKTILNYRTGRFAASAKVEKLSESRQGMITAFYTYMRNPYGTFSQGGRQQNPKSRDPKLLISKSIREIAQNSVANRLRAVLV